MKLGMPLQGAATIPLIIFIIIILINIIMPLPGDYTGIAHQSLRVDEVLHEAVLRFDSEQRVLNVLNHHRVKDVNDVQGGRGRQRRCRGDSNHDVENAFRPKGGF